MAPNFTLPNSIYLIESPLDLTMSPNSEWKKKSSYQEMRITSRRIPISERYFNENAKCQDGISPLPRVGIKELGVESHDKHNGKVCQTVENNIDSQSEKRKYGFARKWLKENLLQTNQAVLAIYSLVAAYSLFCRENGEQPVTESAFLDIIKSEFSGQYLLNDNLVSQQKQNNLVKVTVKANLLNQKRKHAAYVEGEMLEKRQRNLSAVLEQHEPMKQFAVSKYMKLNSDCVSNEGNNSVELGFKKDNSESALKVEIRQQNEVRFTSLGKKSPHSSYTGTQTTKDNSDSDSNDSGCEDMQTLKIKYHDSALLLQNKSSIESDSLPIMKSELHEPTFLEFGNESCDSGLDSFDSDSDKHSDLDCESQKLPYSADDRRGQSESSEESSSKDEEDLGSLVIDETACGNSPMKLREKDIPKPMEIKEELLLDEDTIDEDNQKGAYSSDLSQKSVRESHRKVIANVITLLNLKEFSDSKCFLDARKFSEVFVQMMNNNLLGLFLKVFGHGMSCKAKQCSKLCYMFKRIMKHIASASTHKCAVKHIYGHSLRLHIDTCKDINCGLSNCKLLRGKRLDKRSDQFTSRG